MAAPVGVAHNRSDSPVRMWKGRGDEVSVPRSSRASAGGFGPTVLARGRSKGASQGPLLGRKKRVDDVKGALPTPW